MGGIGKTTIAEFLFDKYSSQYEGSCMLKNVREESQKSGMPHLFEKLVSELLGGESLDSKGSSKARTTLVQRKLSFKKVFIVLDDMNTLEQFEELATQRLGPGSRIIITARDKDVLRKIHGIYELKGLSSENSQDYDGLDELEREIFLDILFFFKGENKDVVISFLESCGFFPAIGMGNLSRKALISISKYNEIEMHDLIEQMGQEIVRQGSIKYPGRRSRLSNTEDVYNVLNNNKGTDSVEGILLDMSRIKRDLHLDADTFRKMPNVRFLKFYESWSYTKSANVYASTLESFPNELRYLEWSGCPVKSLPSTFCAEKLVELCMPGSQVSKLWDGVQDLVSLKKINLIGCEQLVELPDFSHASNLEEIFLDRCLSLAQLHDSILSIHKLETLSLAGCKELKSLKEITSLIGECQEINSSV